MGNKMRYTKPQGIKTRIQEMHTGGKYQNKGVNVKAEGKTQPAVIETLKL